VSGRGGGVLPSGGAGNDMAQTVCGCAEEVACTLRELGAEKFLSWRGEAFAVEHHNHDVVGIF
jgi:hypothetical protein